MAQEKTFQSTLPDILTQLLGQQVDRTQTSSANTGPLQQVYNNASTPMTSELYNQLIQNIFTQASQNVPSLTAALANATGTRSRGNSGLALALNQQNNEAGAAAAQAILGQQNKQAEIAGSAAKGIADSTRTVSDSSTTKLGGGVSPSMMMLGGTLLNKLGKQGGMFDKIGSSLENSFDSFMGTNNGPDLSYLQDISPSAATGFGGAGFDSAVSSFGGGNTSFDFTQYLPSGDDLSQFFDMGSAADIGGSFIDTISNGASSAWDAVSQLWPFADGGMPQQPAMRQQLRPSYAPAINNTVFGYANGGMPMPAGYGGYGNPLQPQHFQPQYGFSPADVISRPGSGMRFADGGQPTVNEGRNLVRTGSQRIDAMESATMNGGDPNEAARNVIAQVMSRPSDPSTSLLAIILSQFGIGPDAVPTPKAYNGPTAKHPDLPQNRVNRSQNFADGGMPGQTDMMYADGGRTGSYPSMQIDRTEQARRNNDTLRTSDSRRMLQEEFDRTTRALAQPNAGAGRGFINNYADGGTIRNKNYMGGPMQRRGMSAYGNLDGVGINTGGGGTAGINSNQIFDIITTDYNRSQRDSGDGGVQSNGFGSVPAEMQGAINSQLGLSAVMGLLGLAGGPMMGLALSGANALGAGLPTMAGSFGKAMALASQGRAIQGELNSRTEAVNNAGGITVDTVNDDGSITISSPHAQQDYTEAPHGSALATTDPTTGVTTVTDPTSNNSYTEAPAGGLDTGGRDLGGTEGIGMGGGDIGAGGGIGAGDYADGGEIKGPGHGTSDSIYASSKHPGTPGVRLSNKEFIMPADVTAIPGMKEHFQSLISAYHTPVRR